MNLKTIAYTALLLMSLNGYAQEYNPDNNSSFHLKNGNIIIGELIEYDVENNIYQILKHSGVKFKIHSSQISKIVIQKNKFFEKNTTHAISNKFPIKNSQSKNHEIGFSLFIVSIESKDKVWQEDNELTHAGFSGFYSHAHTDHLITRFYIYDATISEKGKNIVSDSRISGLEAQILMTTNSNQHGWKFFAGLSAFGEKWDTKRKNSSHLLPTRNTHAGFGITYGLGYNFKKVAIDFSTTTRQKTSYQLPEAQTIASGGLTISHRF